jgi:transcriptional regulator with XRE-family HTH domain
MAKRYKTGEAARPHFLRHWREYRGLSQDKLAVVIGVSKATVSRVESGITPYTQDVLEAYAQALEVHPADLLTRPPADPEGLWAIWDQLRPADRPTAAAVLRAFADGATNRKG